MVIISVLSVTHPAGTHPLHDQCLRLHHQGYSRSALMYPHRQFKVLCFPIKIACVAVWVISALSPESGCIFELCQTSAFSIVGGTRVQRVLSKSLSIKKSSMWRLNCFVKRYTLPPWFWCLAFWLWFHIATVGLSWCLILSITSRRLFLAINHLIGPFLRLSLASIAITMWSLTLFKILTALSRSWSQANCKSWGYFCCSGYCWCWSFTVFSPSAFGFVLL